MSDGSTAILVFDDKVPIGNLNSNKADFYFSPSPLMPGDTHTPPESVDLEFIDLFEPSAFSGAKVNAHFKYDSWVWSEETQDASYVIKMYVDDVCISDLYTFIQDDESPLGIKL